MITRFKAHALFWATFVAGVAADVLSKHLAFSRLAPLGGAREIWPGVFRLNLQENPGGVFSLFRNHPKALMVCGLCALGVVIYLYLGSARSGRKLALVSLGCIAAGAMGNLIDRFTIGRVRDFLDFYYSNYHYPVFNVADIFITVGAGLLIIELLRTRGGEKSEKKPEAS